MAKRYDELIPALKRMLPSGRLGRLARSTGFIQRLRAVRAGVFVWAAVLSRFSGKTPGFAEAQHWYERLGGAKVWPRPFQKRFLRRGTVGLFGTAFDDAVRPWRRTEPRKHRLARFFPDVIAWDSSVVGLDAALRSWFKGVFGFKAALKVCLAVSVFGRLPLAAKVVASNIHDMCLFPDLSNFRSGTLWLFDKGFVAYNWLHEIVRAKQNFLCPMRFDGNPLVVGVRRAPARIRKALKAAPGGIPLRDLLPAKKRIGNALDLDVVVRSKRAKPRVSVRLRLVIVPGPKGKQRPYLTTLSPSPWTAALIRELYRLRWQVELVFKELKQHLALESIPTRDPEAAQAFAWASLIALALSRMVTTWLVPAPDLVGLNAKLRPELLTRELRNAVALLAALLAGALRDVEGGARTLVLTLWPGAAREEAGREDSLARLNLLLPLAA